MVYTPALLLGHGGHGVPGLPAEGDGGVAAMIGKYWSQLTSPGGRQTSAARRGSVDSCDDRDTNSPFTESDAGVEQEERLLQRGVTQRIERCLTEAKASSLHCQVLLLPRRLTGRVGQDVVRSAADEPCGLRGASIGVHVECRDGLRSAGIISPDPSVTPTFELSVIFKADKDDGWPPPLKHIFDTNKVLKLRPEYRLVKRKLYSSASPVIHDFS
ncbi:DNA damage-inducible transcript 4-like protein-like [Scophthalmus maximus]|uniref:DNA damage-inducible transcript 4-like protein n=2 Tax=Scophthalmus maximus TaxID=52904 RepID=A0A8D3AMP9_SCOMX|nr:DNA damage-inducible transcript 4-like protein-like [Scophthalmus maximus]